MPIGPTSAGNSRPDPSSVWTPGVSLASEGCMPNLDIQQTYDRRHRHRAGQPVPPWRGADDTQDYPKGWGAVILGMLNVILTIQAHDLIRGAGGGRVMGRSILNALSSFVRRHLCADIPGEMTACFACNETACSESRFDTCSIRLSCAVPTSARANRPAGWVEDAPDRAPAFLRKLAGRGF
jgi:hypothetical protein